MLQARGQGLRPKGIPRNKMAAADDVGSGRLLCKGTCGSHSLPSTADAHLADDPVAMNPVLYRLHMAVVMIMMMVVTMMHRSGLGRRADGEERCQSYCGSKKQIFHVEPLKHWGTMLRGSRTYVHAPHGINDT